MHDWVSLRRERLRNARLGVRTTRRPLVKIFYCVSLREKVYRDGALTVSVAQFSRYVLQLRVQKRRFDRIREGLGNGKAADGVLVSFCVCAYIKNHCYAKKNEMYRLHQKITSD